jgi:hypothetical protein
MRWNRAPVVVVRVMTLETSRSHSTISVLDLLRRVQHWVVRTSRGIEDTPKVPVGCSLSSLRTLKPDSAPSAINTAAEKSIVVARRN